MTQNNSAHLPPRGVPLSSVETSPVHEAGSVLIRSEEQDFRVLASGQVDNLLLDSGRLTGNEQVDDGVDKVFEAQGKVGIEVGQDGRLGTAFDNEAVSAVHGVRVSKPSNQSSCDSELTSSAGYWPRRKPRRTRSSRSWHSPPCLAIERLGHHLERRP